MKLIEKEKARGLRKQGYSINEIIKETGFTKSSISVWTRDIVLTEKQRNRLTEKGRNMDSVERRRANRLANENARRQIVTDHAKKDYKHISLKELKLIGIILYLGEGGKTERGSARLSNADPMVIKIMMRFFREICGVAEERFRGNIHTFAHADVEETEKYWSQVSGIPRSQFQKTYIKASSASLQKRYTLPYGTFSICVSDTRLFLTIMGWIEKVKELVLVPMV